MEDLEEQEQQNDFEMVISPLPQAAGKRGRPLLLVSGFSILTRRLRAALVVFVVVLVMALLLSGVVGEGRASAFETFFAPAPTATLSPSESVIAVVHWAPWGRLLANGRAVPQLSTPPRPSPTSKFATAAYITTFTLPRGRYTLEYTADPFPVVRCQLTIPVSRGDNCPLSQQNIPSAVAHLAPDARTLDFHVAPEYLPTDAYRALEDAVRQMLATAYSGTASLQPGDHYLDALGQATTAREPLEAQARFALLPDASDPAAARGCTNICSAPFAHSDFLSQEIPNRLYAWIGATAQVRMSYRYTMTDGHIALDDGPITANPAPNIALPIAITWDSGAWHVASQTAMLSADLCPLVIYDVNDGLPAASPDMLTMSARYPLRNWLEGCVVEVTGSPTVTGTNRVVPLFYHFGVVMALAPEAQQKFPSLPRPSAYEQQLVGMVFTR